MGHDTKDNDETGRRMNRDKYNHIMSLKLFQIHNRSNILDNTWALGGAIAQSLEYKQGTLEENDFRPLY